MKTIEEKHYQLVEMIKKNSQLTDRKRHGAYHTTVVGGFVYHIDDYNYALTVNNHYVGLDFGGFKSSWDMFQYRYHVGLLLKYSLGLVYE